MECSKCEFKSKYSSNLRRHFLRFHECNLVIPTGNVVEATGKVVETAGNVVAATGNVVDATGNVVDNFCDICNKSFTRSYGLKIHKETCRGILDPLKCNYCDKIFANRSNKSNHLKICKKKKIDYKELIPIDETNTITTQNIQNANTINNAGRDTITNNVQNIVVFTTDIDESKFNTEEFRNKIKILFRSNNDNFQIIKEYNKGIMSIPENQCVKKTNIKSAHSKVHIGNNEWETKADKEVYPQMVCNLANSFTLELDKLKIKKKELDRLLDCIIDNGYINDTDEKQTEMIHKFTELTRNIKYMIYDISKK
jgi:hypothetical protein